MVTWATVGPSATGRMRASSAMISIPPRPGRGKSHAAGLKLRACAIREAMQGDATASGQINYCGRTAELECPFGLGGQAVAVVDGGTGRDLGGIEVRAGSLRDDAYGKHVRSACGSRRQRYTGQREHQYRSQSAARHNCANPPREAQSKCRGKHSTGDGAVLKKSLAVSYWTVGLPDVGKAHFPERDALLALRGQSSKDFGGRIESLAGRAGAAALLHDRRAAWND